MTEFTGEIRVTSDGSFELRSVDLKGDTDLDLLSREILSGDLNLRFAGWIRRDPETERPILILASDISD
ncbi:MAG: hypothetical protein WAW92_04770 [Minisyncoccia bacterium]